MGGAIGLLILAGYLYDATPVMGGLALARALHSLKPELPIIATSRLDTDTSRES